MMLAWKLLHPRMTLAHLGNIQYWFDDKDPLSAREQVNKHYGFAGGWKPFPKFKLGAGDSPSLCYPEDPPTRPLAITQLRDERIVFYEHSWLAVFQKDGNWEVCRCD